MARYKKSRYKKRVFATGLEYAQCRASGDALRVHLVRWGSGVRGGWSVTVCGRIVTEPWDKALREWCPVCKTLA